MRHPVHSEIPSLNLPAGEGRRLVILGGGFAGLHLARALRGADLQVVLLDRHNFHTFQPLLYQVATAMLEADAVANSFRKIFRHQGNLHFRMVEVSRIDPERKVVETDAGPLSYDYLAVATGARTNFFGHPELAARAFAMKDLSQAIAIRQQLFKNLELAMLSGTAAEREGLLNVIIVGGGPTGIEIAGALGELKKFILAGDYPELDLGEMHIYLVEATGRLLNGMSPKASRAARQALEKLAVTVLVNSQITAYDGQVALTATGGRLPARLLIWVAGVCGNIPPGLDEPSGIVAGRLRVDRYQRLAGRAEIFALGDVAIMVSPETPKGHPLLAPVAIQQARHLAKNLRRLTQPPGRPLQPFTYRDRGIMATIGRNQAIVELPGHFAFAGWPAWLTWLFVHLLTLVGFRNKLIALLSWGWNYLSYDRGIRLIIPGQADPGKAGDEEGKKVGQAGKSDA